MLYVATLGLNLLNNNSEKKSFFRKITVALY